MRRIVLASALVVGSSLHPASARGQSGQPPAGAAQDTAPQAPVDPARASARELAQRGDTEFSAGRCARAIGWWKKAEAAFHAPTILLRIARCQALIGKAVDATATLEAIVAETLPADAPTAFTEARQAAIDELPGVRGRVATLTVDVGSAGGPRDVGIQIRVDDVVHGGARAVVRVDPGAHRVDVAAGSAVYTGTVTVDEGEARTLAVALRAEQPPAPKSTWRTVGLIAGGVGLAAILIGAGFGISATNASSELDEACGPVRTQCPPGNEGRIDRLDAHALVADVLFVAGGLLAAGGTTLAIANPREDPAPARLRITPVGLTPLRFGGRF